ncbi:MATE family efflux transporter [Massilibacteroides vaginae]|uniref:oligosaccharide flippase family protein n=1 Tax=Massilibacteroides vaginae TaxID=1673718 RepID=UPI000A1C8EC5|nr:oligosaccharide flippase family protein [Massilibacteroides vaginae]
MSEPGQVRKNLIFNILSLLANVAVGIFYTPYLVKNLGLIAYGIIPLALVMNQYISVVTGSLTGALTRFYAIALQKGDKEKASKCLSTSLIAMFGIISFLVIPIYLLIQHVDKVFTIPIELISNAKLLFLYTFLSFIFSLFSSVFNVTLYAFNRLDILNIIKIIRVTGKWLFVFFLFTAFSNNISYVGLASFITEMLLLLYSILIFVRFSKGKVSLSFSKFNGTVLKAVGFMALWTMLHQFGDTMLYRIDNILVNIFWSSKESGILGAFTELGNYTMIVASVVGSLFGPLILIAYANDRHDDVKQMTLDRSVSVGVMVAVMIGVLAGFSPIILKIWIGEEFVEYNKWLIVKLALVPFYSAAGIFAFAARAWNKVRFPALMTVFLGGVNFIILYFLASQADKRMEFIDYILVVGLVIGVLQSYFLNGLYFSRFYPNTRKIIVQNFLKIFIVMSGVAAITILLTPVINALDSPVWSIFIIMIISLVLFIFCIKVILNKKQLNSITELIYKK